MSKKVSPNKMAKYSHQKKGSQHPYHSSRIGLCLRLSPFFGICLCSRFGLSLSLGCSATHTCALLRFVLGITFLGHHRPDCKASRSRLKTFTHQVYLILYPSSFFLPRHFIRYSKFKPSTALGDECNWSLYWWVVGRKHP